MSAVLAPWQIALVLVVGFFTGVLSGMFGVGGAVISTPAIRALGASPLEAIGSTLPSILPSSISGTLRYRREGLIRLRTVLWTGLAGATTAVLGALASDKVPGNGHILMIITAGLVGFTAYRLGRAPAAPDPAGPDPEDAVEVDDPQRAAALAEHAPDFVDPTPVLAPAAPEPEPRLEWWRLGIIGIAAGALSGLLGIGGGVLMVPAFVSWARMGLKESLGTSLACVGILAIPGMITHQLLGHINWAYALPLCIGVIPGARVGANLTIRSSDRTLRISVAIVLGLIASIYAVGEIVALFH